MNVICTTRTARLSRSIRRFFYGGKTAKDLAAFALASLLAVGVSAQVPKGSTGIDATGNAASEMAACNNGTSQQSRANCVTEVQNASAAKRAGKLDNSGAHFKANAMKRCDVLAGEDKIACEARVAGYGNSQGSVAGGGVITEAQTVVVPNTNRPIMIVPKNNRDPLIMIPAQK